MCPYPRPLGTGPCPFLPFSFSWWRPLGVRPESRGVLTIQKGVQSRLNSSQRRGGVRHVGSTTLLSVTPRGPFPGPDPVSDSNPDSSRHTGVGPDSEKPGVAGVDLEPVLFHPDRLPIVHKPQTLTWWSL